VERTSVEASGTLTVLRSATDCTVRLPDGEEIPAVLDAEALRHAHGRVYGIRIGGPVRVACEVAPARVVWIEQADG
jgi:hypothetical protein